MIKNNNSKNKIEGESVYVFKKIFELAKPHKKLIILAIFLMILCGILAQVNPIIFKMVLDDVSTILETDTITQDSIRWITFLIFVMVSKEFVLQALNVGLGYIGEKIKVVIGTDMSNDACRHISSLDIDFFDRKGNSPGEIVKRVDVGIEGMSKVVKNIIIDILPLIFTSIIAIVIMFYSNWKVGLLSCLIVPLFTYASIRQAKVNEGTRIQIQDSKEKRAHFMISFVESIKLIKSYLMEKKETNRIAQINETLRSDEIKHHYVNRFYDGVKKFFENVGEVAILGLTSYLVIKGEMTVGAILLHLLLYRNITAPITHLHRIFDEYQEAVTFSRGYFSLLEEKPSIPEPKNPISIKKSNFEGHIIMKDICFSYPNKNINILKSVNMELKPNSLNALIGENGAGKTTIVNLILRFYDPNKGEITIDGTNINKLSKSDLRGQIGIVLQEHHIIEGTISENLRYGKLNASEKEMWGALDLVNLKEQVAKMGFDHPARSLSKGQKQRLAIARIIIKNPRILIFDEPTSAIDPLAVKEIDAVIKNVMKGRTTLVISHNMSSILDADKIFVLNQGEIIQQGTHDELYRIDGHYKKIMKAYVESLKMDKL